MKKNICLVVCFFLVTVLFQVQSIMACACSENIDESSSSVGIAKLQYSEDHDEATSQEGSIELYNEKIGSVDQSPVYITCLVMPRDLADSTKLDQVDTPVCFISYKNQKLFLNSFAEKLIPEDQMTKESTLSAKAFHCGCGNLHNCNACPLIWKKCPCS